MRTQMEFIYFFYCLTFSVSIVSFADEREAVQKKTFTKWVNSHLGRVTCRIGDLYTDLRDGRMLIRLLEVLSGEQLVSITQNTPFPVTNLTQALSMTHTQFHLLEGRRSHVPFFLSLCSTSPLASTFFFSISKCKDILPKSMMALRLKTAPHFTKHRDISQYTTTCRQQFNISQNTRFHNQN